MTSIKEVLNLYNEQGDAIYRFFYFKTLSKSTAEDMTSETFLQVTKSFAQGKRVDQPKAYLYGTARIVFINFLKKKYRDQENRQQIKSIEDLPDFKKYSDEYIKEVELKTTLEDRARPFINMLPDKQRELVTMRLLDKMTPLEIGEKIKKDRNYVKTTIKRGIKKLKQIVALS